MTRSTLLGSLRISRYNPGELSGDGRGGDYERGYRKGWNDAIGFVERELIGYPATSSASPNELTPAEGVAPFSSPSLGALPPSPSSSANSHGETFLPPPDDRSTAVPHAVSGGGSFTNRLGRACTDCGASDGDAHASGCAWITCVPPTEVNNG